MKYKKGDVLEGEKGKIEVIEILGEICICIEPHTGLFRGVYTEKDFEFYGFTLKQEGPWVPILKEDFWTVGLKGDVYDTSCQAEDDEYGIWLIQIGNCFRTKEQAEKYKQWLLTKPYSV